MEKASPRIKWKLGNILNFYAYVFISRIKCTVFQYNYATQVAILNNTYINWSFQPFNAVERFQVFALSAFGLGLISSLRLDDKNIRSKKSAWSTLHSQFKAHSLNFLEGNKKGHKTNREMCVLHGNKLNPTYFYNFFKSFEKAEYGWEYRFLSIFHLKDSF